MNASVSMSRWSVGNNAPRHVHLTRDVLIKAGVLRDPADPEQAYQQARVLAKNGQYAEAASLVRPHARIDGRLGLKMNELLGRCAMYGGGDWESLLKATLQGYRESDDQLGIARTLRDIGGMLIEVGSFDEADRVLRKSVHLFRARYDNRRAALAKMLRARLRLRAGYVNRAQIRIDQVIEELEQLEDSHGLAFARLERAVIAAHQGRKEDAAKDLVAAESYLGRSGHPLERVRARLTRAECLHLLGESRRAANGLKRILVDVIDLEEVPIRAFVHSLLGETLSTVNPNAARQYLMRARHLFARLNNRYQVAHCDVALALVEGPMGLNAKSRFAALPIAELGKWPALAAQYNIARAELCAGSKAERSRQALLKSRTFATDNGDRTLMRHIDLALRQTGLVDEEELNRLGAAEDEEPLARAGISGAPRPEPYVISDITDHDVLVVPRSLITVRMMGGSPTAVPETAALKTPQSVGVKSFRARA